MGSSPKAPLLSSEHKILFLVALIFLIVSLLLLDLPSVGSSSEAREGQVVGSIIRNGDWILPLRNGIVPSKPPLFHWISVPFSRLRGGVSEFSLRVVSAFSASAILYLTMLLAFRMAQSEKRMQPLSISFLAGAALSTSYSFLRLEIDGRVDMLFSLLVVAALYVALIEMLPSGASRPQYQGRSLNLFFFLCGLAVLAKGPLGLVLPLLIVASCLVYTDGLKALFSLAKPRIGWSYFILLTVPYYLFAGYLSQLRLGGGNQFVARQIVFENISRFLGGENIESGPIWFYFPSFISGLFPWSLILVALVVWRLTVEKQRSFSPIVRLSLIWLVVGFVLFSLAAGKRHSYLLPLLPAASIAVSGLFFCWWEIQQPLVRMRFLTVFDRGQRFLLCFVAFLFLLIPLFGKLLSAESLALVAAQNFLIDHRLRIGLFCAILITFSFFTHAVLGKKYIYLRAWFSMASLWLLVLSVGLGVKHNYRQFPQISGAINSLVSKQSRLVVLKEPQEEYFDPVFFYLNREAQIEDIAQPTLEDHIYILVRSSWFYLHKDSICSQCTAIKEFKPLFSEQSKADRDSLILLQKQS